MIIMLATASWLRMFDGLTHQPEVDVRVMPYHRVFLQRKLPAATYVFTDLDRLGFWELELAGYVYRVLQDAGQRVLNNPAHFVSRFGLLHDLHARGHNGFKVWRARDMLAVDRFPVFLRHEAAHRGVLSELLPDAAALAGELARHVREGRPLQDLMIVEYCARPNALGVFRKQAMYRVGDRMVPCVGVYEGHWQAKCGQAGIAGDEAYAEELESLQTMVEADDIRRAFDVAALEYGRADYSCLDGRTHVYEINSNPTVVDPLRSPSAQQHPSAARRGAMALMQHSLMGAMAAIDSPRCRRGVPLAHHALAIHRANTSRWMRPGWLP